MGKIFLAYVWTETESRSNIHSAILTEQAWSKKDLLYGKRMLLSCVTQKVILSREDSPVFPTHIANHSTGFGSLVYLAYWHIKRYNNRKKCTVKPIMCNLLAFSILSFMIEFVTLKIHFSFRIPFLQIHTMCVGGGKLYSAGSDQAIISWNLENLTLHQKIEVG